MNEDQMKELIQNVLWGIGLDSESARELVFRTGKVESNYEYLMQLNDGPAKGFFQCEPWVAKDICMNFLKYRPPLMKQVARCIYVDEKYFTFPEESDWTWILTYNISAQIAMCRLHYRRVPKPLPKSIEDQANYWKKYYNTSQGKGSVEDFIEKL